MDFTSYESKFYEDKTSHHGPRRNIAQILNPAFSNMNYPDNYDFFGNGRYFGGLTASPIASQSCDVFGSNNAVYMGGNFSASSSFSTTTNIAATSSSATNSIAACSPSSSDTASIAATTPIKHELEKYQKERQNAEEIDVKVKEWAERARTSLKEVKQVFVDHLEKAFQECEEFINKQANSIEDMKEVYQGCMLKCQMPLDGIHTDFNTPKNLTKAHRDSGVFKEFTPMKMKLNYVANCGSFGDLDGQFSEPSGICVTSEGLIAVTDTKNHRVQVFDEIGCLKLAFGVSGSNPGQMLYPNCIASCPVTGNFVITERTPVHQIQVYSSAGHFIRRFGQNLLQFPRGVTVDKAGNIIVVECKVMRVTIFDQLGNVIRTFCAPSIMSFPMGICVNDNREIFIADNRRHSVFVFDYNGNNLRSICGNGSISFPISVSINSIGELVVTDNHQSFNMTFFTQKGELVRAYESRNRHSQCLASTVLGVDKICLATKDFRVYMYDCSKGK